LQIDVGPLSLDGRCMLP